MKKTFLECSKLVALLMSAAVLTTSCSTDDIDAMKSDIENLQGDVLDLQKATELLDKAMSDNKTISSYAALENNEGWKITFSDGSTLDIYNGKDGVDGQNGADGADGVDGQDGADGTDGKDGVDGQDGADAIAPVVNVDSDGYWTISTDGGKTFKQLLDANNEPIKAVGKDGEDGKDSQANIVVENNGSSIVIVATDIDGNVSKVDTKIPTNSGNIITSIVENADKTITITTGSGDDVKDYIFGIKEIGITSINILSDDLTIARGSEGVIKFRVSPASAAVSTDVKDYVLDQIKAVETKSIDFSTNASEYFEIVKVEGSNGDYKMSIKATIDVEATVYSDLVLVANTTDVKNQETQVSSSKFAITIPQSGWDVNQITIPMVRVGESQVVDNKIPFTIKLGNIKSYDPALTIVTGTANNGCEVTVEKGTKACSELEGFVEIPDDFVGTNDLKWIHIDITFDVDGDSKDADETPLKKSADFQVYRSTIDFKLDDQNYLTPGSNAVTLQSEDVVAKSKVVLGNNNWYNASQINEMMATAKDAKVMYPATDSKPAAVCNDFTVELIKGKDDNKSNTLEVVLTALPFKDIDATTALEVAYTITGAFGDIYVTAPISVTPQAIDVDGWNFANMSSVIPNVYVTDLSKALIDLLNPKNNALNNDGTPVAYENIDAVKFFNYKKEADGSLSEDKDGNYIKEYVTNVVSTVAHPNSQEFFVEVTYGKVAYDITTPYSVTFDTNNIYAFVETGDMAKSIVYKSATSVDLKAQQVTFKKLTTSIESVNLSRAIDEEYVVASIAVDNASKDLAARYLDIDYNKLTIKSKTGTIYDLEEEATITLTLKLTDPWKNTISRTVIITVEANV